MASLKESIGLVTFTLQARISPRPSASNLEQAANLLCAQANSASYPQRDGKWVVALGLRGEGLVRWMGRWYVCVLHRGSNFSPSWVMDDRIMRHGIISSCQSAATSEIVKHCCSSIVSSAITSTHTFTFLPLHTGWAKKVNPKCSTHNFVKYWPIFKILSLLQSPENLQCSSH